MPARRTTLRYDLALLLVASIWGVNFPVTKAALEVMPIHVFNAIRFTMAVGVLGAIYVARRRTLSAGLGGAMRRYGWRIAGLGLLGSVFYQLCFIVGVNRTAAGSAALIMATSPMWTALLSQVLGFEHLRRLAWGGLGLSLAGTALVIVGGSQQVGLDAASLDGNLIMLAAAALWGAYTALSKPVVRDVAPLTLSLLGILVALPLLYAFSVPGFAEVQWAEVGPWLWGAMLFSGGLSIGLAFFVWSTAVNAVGPSSTAIYANLVPFIALVASVLLLDEAVTWPQVAGGALIVGGVLVMRRGRPGPAETAHRREAETASAPAS